MDLQNFYESLSDEITERLKSQGERLKLQHIYMYTTTFNFQPTPFVAFVFRDEGGIKPS